MMRTLTPIFSIIVALVVFFFFTRPMFAVIDEKKGETEQYDAAVKSATKLNDELTARINQKRGHSTVNTERLNALVPTELDEVKMLVDLKEMAQSHSMLIGNINVVSDKELSPAGASPDHAQEITYESFMTTDISFGLIGTYEQFKGMLEDIEKSLVLMEITNISFTVNEGPLQQFDVVIRAYALPPIN